MEPDLAQLRALRAAVDAGSLDGAAAALHVTPSAISQRLKALESATGRILLVRSRPVRATAAGEHLLRVARQVDLLLADASRQLADEVEDAPVELAVAVNADSLATWWLPAVAELRGEVVLDLRREDQDRTAALLREGTVVAAVTAAQRPIAGCTSMPLGVMRYRPVATPDFLAAWFGAGVTLDALRRAPVVHFDRDDDLQRGWLRRRGVETPPPGHHVPSTDTYEQAVRRGFGWGMLSEFQVRDTATDVVEPLDPAASVDVPLFWQRWKLRSPSLDRLTDVVVAAGRRVLLPVGGG